MKNSIYLAAGMLLLFFAQACQDKKGKNYNQINDGREGIAFIKNGIEGGLMEIKASGMVITKSNNHRVISLAKMIIDDHTQFGDDLEKLKADKKITEADSISPAHQLQLNDLEKKKGAEFDKAYLQMIVVDHEGAVKLFTNAAKNPDDKIRKVAAQSLPTIKMHLDSANAICISLK